MLSTFSWREPDVGRRLGGLVTVRRTYSWDRRLVLSSHYYLAHGDGRGLSFLQWHELEYDAAGWPRLGARHVPKLRL